MRNFYSSTYVKAFEKISVKYSSNGKHDDLKPSQVAIGGKIGHLICGLNNAGCYLEEDGLKRYLLFTSPIYIEYAPSPFYAIIVITNTPFPALFSHSLCLLFFKILFPSPFFMIILIILR